MNTKLLLKTLLIVSLVSTSSYSLAASKTTNKAPAANNKTNTECATKHHAQHKVPEDNIVMRVDGDVDPHAAVYGQHQDEDELLLDAMIPDNVDVLLKSSKIERTHSLKLSAEQARKITELSESLRERNWSDIGKIISSAEKLRDLYAQPKRSAEEIEQRFKHIFDLKRNMIVALINTENKVYDVLSEEQRQMLSGNNAEVKAMH